MMPSTNIKVVYDFYNQQPENSGDKSNSMMGKSSNVVKGSDNLKVKRSNVTTVNSKRTVPSTVNPIKIEGEIIEESERDNRFSRQQVTKKSSNTPTRQAGTSLTRTNASNGTEKIVNKQPETKGKSPVRSTTPINNKSTQSKTSDTNKDTRSGSIRQNKNNENQEQFKDNFNESSISVNADNSKHMIKHSNSQKNIQNRSATPNSRPIKNSTTQGPKLNRSFAGLEESSPGRPKTPKPIPPKNSKITNITKLSSNTLNALSTRNSDTTEGNNGEATPKEFKEFKQKQNTANTSIYNAYVKYVKNAPVKMNANKKNVIEGTLADGDDLDSSSITNQNKSKIEQLKEQNMNNNKNVNIFQVAKEEKELKQPNRFGNLINKKTGLNPNESNNSYNMINKKKVDLKFISTSPLIRKKDYDNLKKNSLKPELNKNASQNAQKVEKKPVVENQGEQPQIKTGENTEISIKKNIKSMFEFSRVGYSGSSKKVNQDNYFVFRNLAGNANHIFLGVCDGHGELGHEVSGYLRENLPFLLSRRLKLLNKNIITDNINSVLIDTFLDINSKLHKSQSLDTSFSGSTCSSMILTPEKVLTANVGDSRAVVGRQTEGGWVSINITRDHKPTEKDEADRIKSQGGRILPFRDEDTGEYVGPARVWIKEEDIPGLAMTRSFGDQCASTVGVCAEPEMYEHKFTDEDKFIIVASDGIWEFIESEECVDIAKEFYLNNDVIGCCEYLYRESSKRWMKEEEVIDDITLIVIFFE